MNIEMSRMKGMMTDDQDTPDPVCVMCVAWPWLIESTISLLVIVGKGSLALVNSLINIITIKLKHVHDVLLLQLYLVW